MSEAQRKKPRFPWLPALLCGASLGVAAWTWMRYSYAWDMTPRSLNEAASETYPSELLDSNPMGLPEGWPLEAYVCLHGLAYREVEDRYPRFDHARTFPGRKLLVHEPGSKRTNAWVHCGDADPQNVNASRGVCGRVYYSAGPVTVDMTSGRFTGASTTGLVVGAMGVFGFAVYLRTWVKGRSGIQ